MAKKKNKKTAKKAVKKIAKKSPAKKKVAKKARHAKKAAAKKKAPAKKAAKKQASKKQVAKPAPPTMSINTYLTFPGNCEEAFNFYKSVFGGDFGYVGRFKDMPADGGKPVPADQGDKIMHISLPIGKNGALMGSDSSDEWGHATVMGNNFSLSINATSKAEADKIYNGLANGGQATMPMASTFWGSYFGMLTDKFGIQWMVSFEQPSEKKAY